MRGPGAFCDVGSHSQEHQSSLSLSLSLCISDDEQSYELDFDKAF